MKYDINELKKMITTKNKRFLCRIGIHRWEKLELFQTNKTNCFYRSTDTTPYGFIHTEIYKTQYSCCNKVKFTKSSIQY